MFLYVHLCVYMYTAAGTDFFVKEMLTVAEDLVIVKKTGIKGNG